MGLNKFALLILLLLPLPSMGQQAEPYMIDAALLAKAMKERPDSFYLIDVRSPEERQQMRNMSIPNTHAWMPVDGRYARDPQYWEKYEAALLKITGGRKDAHIVLYCFFQVHSLPIGMMLMNHGFPNIYSLVNGVRSWYSQ